MAQTAERNGGQRRALNTQPEKEDKHRVQHDVDCRTQKDRHHSRPSKSLCVDEAVHPKAQHYKQGTAQINGQIIIGVRVGDVAGAEQVEQRRFQQKTQNAENKPGPQQKGAGGSHDLPGTGGIVLAACNRKKRGAAVTKEIGESGNHRNNGKCKADACQRAGTGARHMPQINAVHHIVEYIDELREGHGNRQAQNVGSDRAF